MATGPVMRTDADDPLVPGKLSAPDAHGDVVSRPRLHALLDDGVARGVVVISAPPGFGKTMLVTSWAQARPEQHVAWLTLDERDGDPVRFMRYSVAAVRRAADATGRADLDRLLPLPPLTHVDDHYLAALANALADLPEPFVLVLDDFHEVAGSATERLVQRMLRHRPPTLRVVILTRIDPDIAAHRLRLAGQLVELRAVDLSFTEDETRALLEGNGVALRDADVVRLQHATEGWVAALRLATVSLASAIDPAEFVEHFAGDDSYVGEYLLNEVLDRQPDATRDFLLRTCIVDRICGELADVLTGGVGGDRTLADLHRANLFLVAIDNRHKWFRWHQMFADLLRIRLHVEHPGMERELHRRAAAWLEKQAMPVDAARHAAVAGDCDAVVRVIGQAWLDLAMRGDLTTVRGLLALLPSERAQAAPEVAVIQAYLAIDSDDLATTRRMARAAQTLAADLPEGRRVAVQSVAAAQALHVATMTGHDPGGEARRSALRTLAEIPDVQLVTDPDARIRRTLLLYALGAFETCDLDYDVAAAHLREALVEAVAVGLPHIELSCYAQFVSHDFRRGRLGRARKRALEVIETAEARGWSGYHNLATAHDNLAGVAILRDDLDAASQHLSTAAALVRRTDLVNRFNIAFLRGVVLRATGRVAQARETVERLQSLASSWDAPAWVPTSLLTATADQLLAEGDAEGALALLEEVEHDSLGASITRPHGVIYASLLVGAGHAQQAREVLATWTGDSVGRPVQVAALVVDALAAQALGAPDEALAGIDRALAAATRERLLRPIVAWGPEVATLLRARLDLGTPHEALAVDALARLVPPHRAVPVGAPYHVEPLSDRELDVLRHLQGTLSNTEIAARLFVSLNTVKTHVKSINRKLATTGRREAVTRARELGIL